MMKTLDTLSFGTTAKIEDVQANPTLRRRLFDLGFVPGSAITPLFTGVFGDPTAYSIRGTTIALRSIDATKIYLQ